MAQSGSSRVGWAAIDDFTMIRSEDCEYMPREALPSSTQAPPTNTPPNESKNFVYVTTSDIYLSCR